MSLLLVMVVFWSVSIVVPGSNRKHYAVGLNVCGCVLGEKCGDLFGSV